MSNKSGTDVIVSQAEYDQILIVISEIKERIGKTPTVRQACGLGLNLLECFFEHRGFYVMHMDESIEQISLPVTRRKDPGESVTIPFGLPPKEAKKFGQLRIRLSQHNNQELTAREVVLCAISFLRFWIKLEPFDQIYAVEYSGRKVNVNRSLDKWTRRWAA